MNIHKEQKNFESRFVGEYDLSKIDGKYASQATKYAFEDWMDAAQVCDDAEREMFGDNAYGLENIGNK